MEFNLLKKQIKQNIISVIDNLFSIKLELLDVELKDSNDLSKGDFATSIALKITKQLNKKPSDIAEALISNLDKNKYIENVEFANPGFINFYINDSFRKELNESIISQGEKYGSNNDDYITKKIQFEMVSANPTGELHVGHVRNGVIGDIVCRGLEFLGNDVDRSYWANDMGVQILSLGRSVYAFYLEENGLTPEDDLAEYRTPEVKEYAKILNEEVKDKYLPTNMSSEEAIDTIKEMALKHFTQLIQQRVEDLKIKPFTIWYSERETTEGKWTEKALGILKESGKTFEEEGALWLRTTDFGDDKDRVMVKSDGNYTYFTPDVGGHYLKFSSSKNYDLVVDLFGADHHGYERRMHAAINALGFDENNFRIDFIQMVSVEKNGEKFKMSKRAGTSVRAVDILKDIGADLLRYYIANRAKETKIVIDVEKVKDKTFENPFYYFQYAYARACNIIEKSSEIKEYFSSDDYSTEQIKTLSNVMAKLNSTIILSTEKSEPYIISNYLTELGTAFNKFYSIHKVIDNDKVDKELLEYVKSFKIVMENSLKIFNIEPLKEM